MRRLILVAALSAAFAVLCGTVAATGSAPVPAGAEDATSLSAALAAPSAGASLSLDATVPAALARELARDLAGTVPLPSGGTFDGVRWELAGGVFSPREILAILQYNAACQWLRAWRDGREPGLSARVLADTPSWSAWRGGETGHVLSLVVQDAAVGGGAATRAMLAGCDASHSRETEYARALGLTPSR